MEKVLTSPIVTPQQVPGSVFLSSTGRRNFSVKEKRFWTEILNILFGYLSDVEDLIHCSCVCHEWRDAALRSPCWRYFCVELFNFPKVFSHILETEFCKIICQSFIQKQFKNDFVWEFVHYFRTFCGGGEHETQSITYEIANEGSFNNLKRNSTKLDKESIDNNSCDDDDDDDNDDDNDSSDDDDDDDNLLGDTDYHSNISYPMMKNRSKHYEDTNEKCESKVLISRKPMPLFCHLDIYEIRDISEKVYVNRSEISNMSDLWLHTLQRHMRRLDHTKIEQSDLENISIYFSYFLQSLSKAVMMIDDDCDFIYVFYNTMKKTSIFLKLIKEKSKYISNFNVKVIWDTLCDSMHKIWRKSCLPQQKAIERSKEIAISLTRQYYGNYKPQMMHHCFELFYSLDLSKVPALAFSSKIVRSEKKGILREFENRYDCDKIFSEYYQTVSDILKENYKILKNKKDETQLRHMYLLLTAFKQEYMTFEDILRRCPSKSTQKKYRINILEMFIELNKWTVEIVHHLYEDFQMMRFTEIQGSTILEKRYLDIPDQMETMFAKLNINDATECDKFNHFMKIYGPLLEDITRVLDNFALYLLSKNKKYRHHVTNISKTVTNSDNVKNTSRCISAMKGKTAGQKRSIQEYDPTARNQSKKAKGHPP